MCRTVPTVLDNIVWLCGMFGLCLITVTRLPPSPNTVICTRKYQLSTHRLIHALILFCLFFIIMICHVVFYQRENEMTYDVMSLFRRVMNPLVMVLSIAWNVYQRRANQALANQICDLSHNVQKVRGHAVGVRMSRFGWCSATVWSMMCLMQLMYISHAADPPAGLEDYVELFTLLYTLLIILHFASYIFVIKHILVELNKGLEHTMSCDVRDKTMTADQVCMKQLLEYEGLYHQTWIASQQVTQFFSTMIIYTIFFLSNILVVAGFFALYNIKILVGGKGNGEEDWLTLRDSLMCMQWTMFAFIALCFIVVPCSQASNKSDDISTTVNGHIISSRQELLRSELFRFSTILLHEKIAFVPGGFFALNNRLLLTISGLALSYLVIFIEMGDKMKTIEAIHSQAIPTSPPQL